MKAVYIEQTGGADMLRYGDMPKPEPSAGQALVRIAAAGVNFIDTYHRAGLYKIPLPGILGSEGAGTVESIGEGVTGIKPGDRVAWAMARGSYAEYATVPASHLVPIPASVDFNAAAAALLQGMTAHYLTHSTFPLKRGQTALAHAAAGGTGRLIVQMAKMLGARVIGTAGSAEKAKIAREAGADEVILYREQDFKEETRKLTGGAGVDVVYDAVGASTFMQSIDCLRPRGMMVSFGNASGPVPRGRAAAPQPEGFAVPDPSDSGELHGVARRIGMACGGCFPLGGGEKAESADRSRVPSGRGCAGAARSGKPEDQRQAGPQLWITASVGRRGR